MPGNPPVRFHKPLFESRASIACTFSIQFLSRVMPAMLVRSYCINSFSEVMLVHTCTPLFNSFWEPCRQCLYALITFLFESHAGTCRYIPVRFHSIPFKSYV